RSGGRVAGFSNDNWDLLCNRSDHSVPAELRRALRSQAWVGARIAVPRGGHVRVRWSVGEPARQVAGPGRAGHHDHVLRPGAANVCNELVHAGRLPVLGDGERRAAGLVLADRAAIEQTGELVRTACWDPVEEGFVVQVVDHALVALEGRGNRPPEGGRVVLVGGRVLAQCKL